MLNGSIPREYAAEYPAEKNDISPNFRKKHEDNSRWRFFSDIGALRNKPSRFPGGTRNLAQGEPRGCSGHLSSSASWCPDTRQRTLLNQLKLCRPRGVADLSSKYESGKDGANTGERQADEGERENGRKFNSQRNEG